MLRESLWRRITLLYVPNSLSYSCLFSFLFISVFDMTTANDKYVPLPVAPRLLRLSTLR